MPRVSKEPVRIPPGVGVVISETCVQIKGPQGQLDCPISDRFIATYESGLLSLMLKPSERVERRERRFIGAWTGTLRAHLHNAVKGVVEGYRRELTLVGVGYRGEVQGDVLTLYVGFTNPRRFLVPAGVKLVMPSATEIVITGVDKHLVGKVVSEIRALQPVEPYKGKGIRYKDEKVTLKEIKKKK